MKGIPWEVDCINFSDAYVAGFFDGDGSLVAILEKQSSKYSRTYRPRIRVNFTQHIRHKNMLEDLKIYLGAGEVRLVSSHDLAELVIQDRQDIRKILERMFPHLVLKRKQAIIALEVLDLLGDNIRTNRISDENYSEILKKISEIRSLNSKTGGKRKIHQFDPVTTFRLNERVAETLKD